MRVNMKAPSLQGSACSENKLENECFSGNRGGHFVPIRMYTEQKQSEDERKMVCSGLLRTHVKVR